MCYAKNIAERAFTWKNTGQYSHFAVDDGESRSHHHKSSPVLVADGSFNAEQTLVRFKSESSELPPDISQFVIEKLQRA